MLKSGCSTSCSTGPESKASGQARAVVMVNMDQTDTFAEYIAANSTGVEADKLLFALSGTALTGTIGSFDELVEKALVRAGLTKAPGFIVVHPWLNGREAALKTDPKDEALMIQFFGAVGGGLSLIARMLKFLFRNRKSALVSQPTLRAETQSPYQLPMATAPGVFSDSACKTESG